MACSKNLDPCYFDSEKRRADTKLVRVNAERKRRLKFSGVSDSLDNLVTHAVTTTLIPAARVCHAQHLLTPFSQNIHLFQPTTASIPLRPWTQLTNQQHGRPTWWRFWRSPSQALQAKPCQPERGESACRPGQGRQDRWDDGRVTSKVRGPTVSRSSKFQDSSSTCRGKAGLRRVSPRVSSLSLSFHAKRTLIWCDRYCEKKLGKTDLTDADIWNVETITERTCDLFFCMAEYATSTFGGKPEAGVLQQQKYGMYWWIIRFIPGFSTIYQTWDSMTTAAINRAALDTNFTSEFLPKNKLTDAELELFWQEIPKFPSDRETWLQNYIAWLMVYTTASRPGSFTVTRGYGKNDVLPNGTFRTEAETMRWSDITFTRHQNVAGLAVRVTFRYLKAHKTPEFGNPVDARRTFTLMPLISDHYEFDLGLLLVALAYSRGLFPNYPNVASLFQGTRRLVEKDPKVDGQAVFVASNEAGTLEADVPMHTLSLNLQLRKLCDAVALLGRNTMHCFRRAAITKMRRDEGTETPTNLAARDAADTRTIYAYDDKSLGNYDIVNKAMDVSSMDRNTIREMFSQVNTARIQLPEDLTSRIPGLQDKLNAEADARAKNDDENVEQDRDNDDEAAADMTRAEPSQWDQLPDEVILQPGQTVEEGGATHKGRVQLVERFVALVSINTTTNTHSVSKLIYSAAIRADIRSSLHSLQARPHRVVRAEEADLDAGEPR